MEEAAGSFGEAALEGAGEDVVVSCDPAVETGWCISQRFLAFPQHWV